MRKLASLCALLRAAVPSLTASPDGLSAFVDKGKVAARRGSLSFEYGYTASLWLPDFSGTMDALVVPLLSWISDNQPDLLDRSPNEPFSFESEILDSETADITITIELTELVRVEKVEAGLKAVHLPGPKIVDCFPGAEGATLWKGIGDDLAAGVEFVTPNE